MSSLRTVGGGSAVWPPELLKRLEQRLPWARPGLGLGYGMTETNGLGTSLSRESRTPAPSRSDRRAPPCRSTCVFRPPEPLCPTVRWVRSRGAARRRSPSTGTTPQRRRLSSTTTAGTTPATTARSRAGASTSRVDGRTSSSAVARTSHPWRSRIGSSSTPASPRRWSSAWTTRRWGKKSRPSSSQGSRGAVRGGRARVVQRGSGPLQGPRGRRVPRRTSPQRSRQGRQGPVGSVTDRRHLHRGVSVPSTRVARNWRNAGGDQAGPELTCTGCFLPGPRRGALRRLRDHVGPHRVADRAPEDVDRAECSGRPTLGSGGTRPDARPPGEQPLHGQRSAPQRGHVTARRHAGLRWRLCRPVRPGHDGLRLRLRQQHDELALRSRRPHSGHRASRGVRLPGPLPRRCLAGAPELDGAGLPMGALGVGRGQTAPS